MLNPLTVLAVFCLYMVGLFLTALIVERKSVSGRSPVNNPLVYSLSLAVYCTGWTYYGSVGKAATSGLLFMPIYLGPTIAIVLWWATLRKLVRIKSKHHITSIADFVSARYNKSQAVAALATVIALSGVMPYIALQFKAIFTTFAVLTSTDGAHTPWVTRHIGPVVLSLMISFTLILGVRRIDPTERHPGLIMAVAVECLVKLAAFLIAGGFVTYFMFDGFGDIFQRVSLEIPEPMAKRWTLGHESSITWMTYLFLAMSAVVFLPRQFHVAVVENFDEKHIRTAIWMFPLYMLLINLFVLPIALGGVLKGYPPEAADTFVLALPLHEGQRWLSVLVFIGGTSAATGMIMISSITVATMITNHLLLPVMGWIPWLSFLRRKLLRLRWGAVAGVIIIGYWFERQVGESYMLVNIGMIAFAAVLQFGPATLHAIFWKRGNEAGALLGMGSGFLIWFYTLLAPAFVRSGWIHFDLLENGPFGLAFLRPEQLFGVALHDPLTHTVIWSMVFNVGLYVFGSLLFKQSEGERAVAEDFVDVLTAAPSHPAPSRRGPSIDLNAKRLLIKDLLCQYFAERDAEVMTEKAVQDVGLGKEDKISIVEFAELHGEVEKALAGAVGAAAAHKAMAESAVFSRAEARELSEVYAEILSGLVLTPEELKRKIDYYKERETLLTEHAEGLERKVRERTRDLEEAQAELIKREKLAVLGRLTAVVSHELRNPLGVIRFSNYYVMRHIKDRDDKIRKHLERIETQVGLCDSIIQEMLEYTRGTRSALVPGDFNAWLKDVLEQIPVPEPARVTLVATPDLPVAHFDGQKLRRVVINLVENAIQAVQARREAETDRFYKPEVRVITSREEQFVRMEVKDNGIGMDDETSARAFDPLFTTRPRGTGLGLAIVRKIVEEHGGKVFHSSKPNEGASMTVLIPIA